MTIVAVAPLREAPAQQTPVAAERAPAATAVDSATPGSPPSTEARLRLAIRNNPADATLHSRLADLLLQDGRHAEARDAYSEAVRLNPRSPENRYGLGSAALAIGQFAEAESQFAWGAQIDPTDPAMQIGLGEAALARGHPELAVPHFRRAVELSADSRATRTQAETLLLTATHASSELSGQRLAGKVRQGLLYAALATMTVAGVALAIPVAEGLMLLLVMAPVAAMRKKRER